jgi:hypothetical protein
MNFLTVFLARFFDSLKLKNPTVYFLLATLVVGLNLTINNVMLQDLYAATFGELPNWFNTVIQVVSVLYLAVTAPRTSSTIAKAEIESRRKF